MTLLQEKSAKINLGNFGYDKSFFSFASENNEVEMQDRILHKGDEMFRKLGIRSVTMDDIAKQLGISKKTLYQFYPDKEELVFAVTKLNLDKHVGAMDHICGPASMNAVEELLNVNNCITFMIQSYNPIMFYDLQKYHPKSWLLFKEFRNTYILSKITSNFERGIAEGLYRHDLDMDILSIMRLEQIDMGFNYDIYPPTKFHFPKVTQHITEHFLYGLVTLKGHKLINKYKNIKEDE